MSSFYTLMAFYRLQLQERSWEISNNISLLVFVWNFDSIILFNFPHTELFYFRKGLTYFTNKAPKTHFLIIIILAKETITAILNKQSRNIILLHYFWYPAVQILLHEQIWIFFNLATTILSNLLNLFFRYVLICCQQ